MDLLFIGHGSFRLTTRANTTVYIDPFKEGDYGPIADLVLITHEHFDHNKTELVSLKEDGIILRAADFIDKQEYKTIAVKDLVITAVPAYNKNHPYGCVGYVIEADGLKLYFAGDTSKTDYMSKLNNIDYAFLPTDGIYNMDAEEATICAKLIDAKYSVPVHTERPDEDYNEEVAEKFTPENRLIIKPNQKITL